jgi:hypothetical protein
VIMLAMTPYVAQAAFTSGSTGADGALAPATNAVLTVPESGVFNFTTVNIPSGVTITFTKNSKNSPVTILASGNVTIAGAINLNGTDANGINPGVGGPGGFDGGQGGAIYLIGKRGEGPGGGGGGSPRTDSYYGAGSGAGGGFAGGGGNGGTYTTGAPGGSGGSAYSSERILPAIGGSGGGGGGGTNTYVGGGGGGGGGAIVIASSGVITVTGSITANGGAGANSVNGTASGGGGGSGGSIRLIATTITGSGSLTANGAGGGSGYSFSGGGGSAGRIRLEQDFKDPNNKLTTSPSYTNGPAYGVTPQNMPTLTISSIGGVEVPSVPSGSLNTPDVQLPYNTTNPVTVVVTGAYIPANTTVTVNASPTLGNVTSATGTLSGSGDTSTASVSLSIATAYPSIITASVTYQLTAANGGPIYAGGERVDRVRVAANLGGGSTITYITESGKEIPATM